MLKLPKLPAAVQMPLHACCQVKLTKAWQHEWQNPPTKLPGNQAQKSTSADSVAAVGHPNPGLQLTRVFAGLQISGTD
jgi:hypothetical protein